MHNYQKSKGVEIMRKINQKECIKVNFSNGPGIFNELFGYTEIDDQEIYNGLTDKVVDKQGPQVHSGGIFFLPERKELIFDFDESPHLHIAMAELTFKEDS